jgi:cell wall hydrolase
MAVLASAGPAWAKTHFDLKGALHPAPPPPLEIGDCGPAVHELREALARSRYMGHAAGAGRCYDELTYHAVMAFQKWADIDRDGLAGPQTKRALKQIRRPEPFASGDGERIEIDISSQLAELVRDGKVLRIFSISSGASGYDTPTGDYEVYLQDEDAYSYKYDAPMPWASFFNGGIAIHESSDVPGYPASHGCVRMPASFAERVFRFAELGTPVVVVD